MTCLLHGREKKRNPRHAPQSRKGESRTATGLFSWLLFYCVVRGGVVVSTDAVDGVLFAVGAEESSYAVRLPSGDAHDLLECRAAWFLDHGEHGLFFACPALC